MRILFSVAVIAVYSTAFAQDAALGNEWQPLYQLDEPNGTNWQPYYAADTLTPDTYRIDSQNWLDIVHDTTGILLQNTADEVNSWFGDNNPERPARLQARIMLDNSWNRYDGYSIRPRIRGSIRLPALQDRLHLVFGDTSLDNQPANPADPASESSTLRTNGKTISPRQTRSDNGSIGLQLDAPSSRRDFKANFRLGLRSHGDLYARVKGEKTWDLGGDNTFRAEQVYRYGLKSEHYARTNLQLRNAPEGKPFTSSQLSITYENLRPDHWRWSNSIYRQHSLGGDSWFNYGLSGSGSISSPQFALNSYGPFTGFRKNIYRDWLFLQSELTYYNDKKADRSHNVGAFMRLEAQF